MTTPNTKTKVWESEYRSNKMNALNKLTKQWNN